jgi:NAD(P)H dehydrogenase (quinone)
MNLLLLLAHPGPNSFCHALATPSAIPSSAPATPSSTTTSAPNTSIPSCPHRKSPPPRPSPRNPAHCDELQAADGIVVVHPNWWGQPPAVLKGWIDRVIRPGIAYRFVEKATAAKASPSACSAPGPPSSSTPPTPRRARTPHLRRSPRGHLEALHLRTLRRPRSSTAARSASSSPAPPDQRQAWLAEAIALCQPPSPRPPLNIEYSLLNIAAPFAPPHSCHPGNS